MEFDFTQPQLAFQQEVRAFLEAELTAGLRADFDATPTLFAEPDLSLEWQAILHRRGWLAYDWPVDAGGTGWGPVERYIFEKECALAGAPSLPVMGLKLLGPVINRFGTARQKAEILPRILDGQDVWCQGFSEPGSGSDLASLRTTAVRDGDRYIVNGTKMWTTHAHHSNRIFCLVRTDPAERRNRGISFLLMDMDQPGISVSPILTLGGDHEVNQLFFDNAAAQVHDLVGEEGQGWEIAKFLLENERGGSCLAPRLISDLARLNAAAEREADGMGGTIAEQASWRRALARLELEVASLEMIELRVLAEIAQGRPPGPQTSMIKLLASDLHRRVDEVGMQLYGPAGMQLEMRRPLYGDRAPDAPLGKGPQIGAARYLASRAWTIFGGTNEIQSTIIAKSVLGL